MTDRALLTVLVIDAEESMLDLAATIFREHQEIIEAGRLRGPVYKVIQGAELAKWVGCS
jgi:hypothetical protein